MDYRRPRVVAVAPRYILFHRLHIERVGYDAMSP